MESEIQRCQDSNQYFSVKLLADGAFLSGSSPGIEVGHLLVCGTACPLPQPRPRLGLRSPTVTAQNERMHFCVYGQLVAIKQRRMICLGPALLWKKLPAVASCRSQPLFQRQRRWHSLQELHRTESEEEGSGFRVRRSCLGAAARRGKIAGRIGSRGRAENTPADWGGAGGRGGFMLR